jgi:peptidylprolyl isomerase/peptidyl-prolyl cis-trans isomerase B (cyclophilin B)
VASAEAPYVSATVPAANFVKIETAKGDVIIQLYPTVAPNTVKSFKYLIDKGFYNGLTFHRVVPQFVVQGGDPDGNGTGGPGYNINAEFTDIQNRVGTVAMARTSDPNSAGSQFYIVTNAENAASLDGQYTIFGQVISGMDVVNQIQQGDKMEKVSLVDSLPSGVQAEPVPTFHRVPAE